jgi:hypothetical protein
VRRARPRRQLSPQSLALGVSIAYAMIVGIGGSVLVTPAGQEYYPESRSGALTATSYPEPTTPPRYPTSRPSRTTTSTTTFDVDIVTTSVSGGGGIFTEVPASWSHRSLSATLDEAVDPTNKLRLLRYGGAPATDGRSLLYRIADAERKASIQKSGYVQLRLDPVAFHDAEAVAWEYEYYDKADNRLHCSARYWMAGGVEYVLHVQSPHSDWEETEPVLERMVETAGPVL